MGIINLSFGPLSVALQHNDVVVEEIDEGFPELTMVYIIDHVIYTNLTEQPWTLRASSDKEWTTVIAANESGSINIPPPQRYKSFPLTFRMTLIRD